MPGWMWVFLDFFCPGQASNLALIEVLWRLLLHWGYFISLGYYFSDKSCSDVPSVSSTFGETRNCA